MIGLVAANVGQTAPPSVVVGQFVPTVRPAGALPAPPSTPDAGAVPCGDHLRTDGRAPFVVAVEPGGRPAAVLDLDRGHRQRRQPDRSARRAPWQRPVTWNFSATGVSFQLTTMTSVASSAQVAAGVGGDARRQPVGAGSSVGPKWLGVERVGVVRGARQVRRRQPDEPQRPVVVVADVPDRRRPEVELDGRAEDVGHPERRADRPRRRLEHAAGVVVGDVHLGERERLRPLPRRLQDPLHRRHHLAEARPARRSRRRAASPSSPRTGSGGSR